MTFRDDVRRDFAELDRAGRVFWDTLIKELRIEWMLRKLTTLIERLSK